MLFRRAPGKKDGERQGALPVAEGAPLVAITEDDHRYVIKTELPGVKQKALTGGGPADALPRPSARNEETDAQDNTFQRGEQACGRFARRGPLPEDFNDDRGAAAFKDGRMHVHWPTIDPPPPPPQAP